MKLYVTRHGQTDWNVEGRMQGSMNSNLTEEGKKDAIKLGVSLKETKIDYIYSSPLTRAYDTALLIKGERNIPIVVHDHLKEMNFGIWEGMPNNDVIHNYEAEHYHFWNEPHQYTPMGGETFEELMDRVKLVLNELLVQHQEENLLLVTHTIVIKAIYAILKEYELKDFWNPPFIHNTCMTLVEYKNEQYEFILEADTSHMD